MTFDECRRVFEILQKLDIMSGQGEQGEGEAQEDVEMIEVDEETQGPVQQPSEPAVRYLRSYLLV